MGLNMDIELEETLVNAVGIYHAMFLTQLTNVEKGRLQYYKWFRYTYKKMTDATGLSYRSQRKGIDFLVSKGILETQIGHITTDKRSPVERWYKLNINHKTLHAVFSHEGGL